MPSLVFTLDGVVVKEIELTKVRTTLGRRPNNDIVVENLTVSGEHAVFHLSGQSVQVQDLHSTNGTFVNGQPIERHTLHDGDQLIIGRYEVRFWVSGAPAGSAPAVLVPAPADASAREPRDALVRVLTGPGAGREVPLVKIVTTLGKPGGTVASITHRPHGFVLAQVEGDAPPRVNGRPVGKPQALNAGDRIMLADVEMEFVLR